jgi:hypothetical protein
MKFSTIVACTRPSDPGLHLAPSRLQVMWWPRIPTSDSQVRFVYTKMPHNFHSNVWRKSFEMDNLKALLDVMFFVKLNWIKLLGTTMFGKTL